MSDMPSPDTPQPDIPPLDPVPEIPPLDPLDLPGDEVPDGEPPTIPEDVPFIVPPGTQYALQG
jgi:hypothetical protein